MQTTETRTPQLSYYTKRRLEQERREIWSAEAEAILKKARFRNQLKKLYPKVRHAKD